MNCTQVADRVFGQWKLMCGNMREFGRSPTDGQKKPHSTMKRFSLRTLLIATAVIALLMALPIRRAIEQKRGRDWVASQNGRVTMSVSRYYNQVTRQWADSDSLPAPQWIVDALGIDFFDTVKNVTLDNMEVKDLSPITDLRDLRRLNIIIEIDDQLDFSPLAELPKLRHLHLDYTNISAERLAKLRELLPNVRVDATNHPPPD